jgi:hypothetical protein
VRQAEDARAAAVLEQRVDPLAFVSAPIRALANADNDMSAFGATKLAPSLLQMPQLASLSLASTLHALLEAAGSVERGARPRGAAVRADNRIGVGGDGAAALAPSLLRMTQLTSLNLAGTPHPSVGLGLWRMNCTAGRLGCFCMLRAGALVRRAEEMLRIESGAPMGWRVAGNGIVAAWAAALTSGLPTTRMVTTTE